MAGEELTPEEQDKLVREWMEGYTPDPYPGSVAPPPERIVNRPTGKTPLDDLRREVEGDDSL